MDEGTGTHTVGNGNVLGSDSKSQVIEAKNGSIVDVNDVVHTTAFHSPALGPVHTGSGDIYYFYIDAKVLKSQIGEPLGNNVAPPADEQPSDNQQEKSESSLEDDSLWTVVTPTIGIGSWVQMFPGTAHPSEIHIIYAGNYEVVFQHRFPDDQNPKIILTKDGQVVKPIVDPEERTIRFPKSTVWMTDRLVIPLSPTDGRPDKETWIVKLPDSAVSQRVVQQYGLEKVYLSQEFEFENDYRIVASLNTVNPSGKQIEVYFYYRNKQIQPVIDHDTRTVAFPSKSS